MENILANHVSRLCSIGFYDTLDHEEGGTDFGHVLFEESPPSMEQNEFLPVSVKQNKTIVNKKQHVPIKLDQKEIKNMATKIPTILQNDQQYENKKYNCQWRVQYRSPRGTIQENTRPWERINGINSTQTSPKIHAVVV